MSKRKKQTVAKKDIITGLERTLERLRKSRRKELTAGQIFEIFLESANRAT